MHSLSTQLHGPGVGRNQLVFSPTRWFGYFFSLLYVGFSDYFSQLLSAAVRGRSKGKCEPVNLGAEAWGGEVKAV